MLQEKRLIAKRIQNRSHLVSRVFHCRDQSRIKRSRSIHLIFARSSQLETRVLIQLIFPLLEQSFANTLDRIDSIPNRLRIPFASLKRILDPIVRAFQILNIDLRDCQKFIESIGKLRSGIFLRSFRFLHSVDQNIALVRAHLLHGSVINRLTPAQQREAQN